MAPTANKETNRQYRVARQTLGMHALLRDRFALRSRIAELVLLLVSVIFCATTFAGDDLYRGFDISPAAAHLALGVASIVAFAFSLTLVVVSWNEAWADHREATARWARVVETFRAQRADDGTWPNHVRDRLNDGYWEAAGTITPIPERKFNGLKKRYLRKVAISEMTSRYPSAPSILLSLVLRARDVAQALRHASHEPDRL